MPIMKRLVAISMLLGTAAPLQAAADEYEWLEGQHDPKALAWAAEQTARSRKTIASMPDRATVRLELTQLIAGSDPPPELAILGSLAVRFQRSAAHPRGIMSVASRDAQGGLDEWRDVLDVGALRGASGAEYDLQFYGMEKACLPPEFTRCMLSLPQPGGLDFELREFDLLRGEFVPDGFHVPASQGGAIWMDVDHLLINHGVGAAPKLPNGSAAATYLWERGSPLDRARVVFRAEPTDARLILGATGVGRDRVGSILRMIDSSTFETLLVRDNGVLERTSFPLKIKPSVMSPTGGRLVAQLAEPYEIGGRIFPAETVIAYDTAQDTPDTKRLSVIYAPRTDEFLTNMFGIASGISKVRMIFDRRGLQRMVTATHRGENWVIDNQSAEAIGTTISFGAVDPNGDDVIVRRSGYLLPSRLELVTDKAAPKLLFSEAPVIDADKFSVALQSARSKDGTDIDYFLLRPKTLLNPGETPTLLTAYGGFGSAHSPTYFDLGVGGKSLASWLMRGGALAVALVRGGGERGEAWHQAAIREKRQNSFDDFAAVSEALIADGFTRPARLGAFGRSNGGLLAAVMGTQRPDLYGAIVSDVPLADLLRMGFMGMGAAWAGEYGDLADPAIRAAINRYSPFQNIAKGRAYPPFLITASTSDDVVGPGHARKLVAKLNDAGAEALYLEEPKGGHMVSNPLTQPDLMADRMTFLINRLMVSDSKDGQ